MRKGGSSNTTNTKRDSKQEIKKQFVDSLFSNKKVEAEELNKQAEKVENSEDAGTITKEYEDVILTKKKNIIRIAHQQGKLFRKFKEKGKFIKLVKELKVHKITIIFKINIVKLTDKYPKLMKSSVTLNFCKNLFKDVKEVRLENLVEFK